MWNLWEEKTGEDTDPHPFDIPFGVSRISVKATLSPAERGDGERRYRRREEDGWTGNERRTMIRPTQTDTRTDRPPRNQEKPIHQPPNSFLTTVPFNP